MRSTMLQIFISSGFDCNLPFMAHSEVICAFSCASQSYFWKEMHIHTDCICKDFPHVFLNVSSHHLKWNKKSHNVCTWMVLRHLPDPYCVFFCVSSMILPRRRHCYIDHTCRVFPQYALSCASSSRQAENMHNYIDCNCRVFPQCVSSCASLSRQAKKMHNYIDCIDSIFLFWCTDEFSYGFSMHL